MAATGSGKASLDEPRKLSADLAEIVGKKEASRAQCVKLLWGYIKKHKLLDPENKQYFTPNEKMSKVFGTDRMRAFAMSKFLSAHLSPISDLNVSNPLPDMSTDAGMLTIEEVNQLSNRQKKKALKKAKKIGLEGVKALAAADLSNPCERKTLVKCLAKNCHIPKFKVNSVTQLREHFFSLVRFDPKTNMPLLPRSKEYANLSYNMKMHTKFFHKHKHLINTYFPNSNKPYYYTASTTREDNPLRGDKGPGFGSKSQSLISNPAMLLASDPSLLTVRNPAYKSSSNNPAQANLHLLDQRFAQDYNGPNPIASGPDQNFLEENEDEFPWGEAFPTNLDSARKLFDHLEEVFLTKSSFIIADVPGHVVQESVEKVFGFDSWTNRTARHQNQPTVDLSSQNRKRSAEPELFESLRSKTGRDRRLREVDQHDLRAYIFDSQNSERSKEGKNQMGSNSGRSQVIEYRHIKHRSLSELAESLSVSESKVSSVQRLKDAAVRLEQSSKPEPAFVPEPTPDFDLCLRPGNYLFATLDVLLFKEEGTGQSHICQIGCTLAIASGDSFGRWNFIKEVALDQSPFTCSHKIWYYNCDGKQLVVRNALPDVKKGINVMLDFLEKGCRKTRPPFDGVVLMAHNKEMIKHLMAPILTEQALKDRFFRIVKGVGDLTSYLLSEHHEVYGNDPKFLKLDAVALNTVRRNTSLDCDSNSKIVNDIVTTLVQGPPTYPNFFSKHIHSLNSKAFHDLCKVDTRTINEKLNTFFPIKRFIAYNLIKEESRLVVMGMGELKHDTKLLSKAQVIADVIARSLLANNLKMPDMLDLFLKDGVDAIDLLLRTSFLKMALASQSPAVADQITRCAKLILSFFEKFGHRSLEDLVAEFQAHILPPRGISLDLWADYEPIARFIQEKYSSKMIWYQLEHSIRVLMVLLYIAGLDHSKLAFIWQQGRDFFLTSMQNIISFYSKQIGSKPKGLKFEAFHKVLAEYFTDPNTNLQTSETIFPFCMWQKYCYLADEFVSYFSKQISVQVCEEEAIILVNALIGEGVDHATLHQEFLVNNPTGPMYIRSLLDKMTYSKPPEARLISNAMIFMFLSEVYMQDVSKKRGKQNFNPDDETLVKERPWNWRPTPSVDVLTDCLNRLNETLPKKGDMILEAYTTCFNSLEVLVNAVTLKMKTTVLICGGNIQRDLPLLAEFIQKMFAASGLNFVTLKSLQKTVGLNRAINKCFEKHFNVLFPGITANNIAKLIDEYFGKFTFSRNPTDD